MWRDAIGSAADRSSVSQDSSRTWARAGTPRPISKRRAGAIRSLGSTAADAPTDVSDVRHDPEGKLERLLDAAFVMFAERGYHATTIHEICARAEVGVGTFYSHFVDKREAIQRLFESNVQLLLGPLARLRFDDEKRIHTELERLANNRRLAGFWRSWREAVSEDARLEAITRSVGQASRDELVAAIERARESAGGADGLVDAASAAWMTTTLVREALANPEEAPPLTMVARAIRTLVAPSRSPGR